MSSFARTDAVCGTLMVDIAVGMDRRPARYSHASHAVVFTAMHTFTRSIRRLPISANKRHSPLSDHF